MGLLKTIYDSGLFKTFREETFKQGYSQGKVDGIVETNAKKFISDNKLEEFFEDDLSN